MPIYEFHCEACDAEVEEILPLGKTLKKCPECGKLKLKQKQFSRTVYHDLYSPCHPRRGRGVGGYGRVDEG